jgi:predicted kinase
MSTKIAHEKHPIEKLGLDQLCLQKVKKVQLIDGQKSILDYITANTSPPLKQKKKSIITATQRNVATCTLDFVDLSKVMQYEFQLPKHTFSNVVSMKNIKKSGRGVFLHIPCAYNDRN